MSEIRDECICSNDHICPECGLEIACSRILCPGCHVLFISKLATVTPCRPVEIPVIRRRRGAIKLTIDSGEIKDVADVVSDVETPKTSCWFLCPKKNLSPDNRCVKRPIQVRPSGFKRPSDLDYSIKF